MGDSIINARLDGQWVYGSFLSPIENGTYIRQGKRFIIRPSVWFFAGTDAKAEGADKLKDFESRLTLPPIDMGKSNAPVESAYMGSQFLLSQFPEVKKIEKKIFSIFDEIGKSHPFRYFEQFVHSFTNVTNDEVTLANVPFDWLEDQNFDDSKIRRWKNQVHSSDRQYVTIVK